MNKQTKETPVWREAATNNKSKEQQKKVPTNRINPVIKKIETR